MSYPVEVFQLIIASPSDLMKERRDVREAVLEWNSINSKNINIMFQPVMWEMDSVPNVGSGPQDSINEQLIHDSDVIVALFWTKLGTPTSNSHSGTLEEIQHFINNKKPGALYFSKKSVNIDQIDIKQLRALNSYKASISNKSYYDIFNGPNELKNKIMKYLNSTAKKLKKNINQNALTKQFNEQELVYSNDSKGFNDYLLEASRSNASGFYISIIADFGNGYKGISSNDVKYVQSWSEQLLKTIFDEVKALKQEWGRDYVISSFPKDSNLPFLFRVHFSNDGIVCIQWCWEHGYIPLDWIITLCLVSLVQLVNSPVVVGENAKRIGLVLSNSPEQGISTSSVFQSTKSDRYLKGVNSIWEKKVEADFNIDESIKEFIHYTLFGWGYTDYEDHLANTVVSIVKTEFLLRQRGLSFVL